MAIFAQHRPTALGLITFLAISSSIATAGANVDTTTENTAATTSADSSGKTQLAEVVVTARKRRENLQDVPDSITTFTAEKIESAGIQQINDFMSLVPNLVLADGSSYYPGLIDISMRGIGNAQEGWPSVAFLIDGVPADSTDRINSGSLLDVERIEVLRGPQSALYGAGAIAGAINIVTKAPTNEWAFKVRTSYGNGDDRKIDAALSGPIVSDVLQFSAIAAYRDDHGLFTSAPNGLDLAFIRQWQAILRAVYKPNSDLTVDMHFGYDREFDGANYEDLVPSVQGIDDFNPLYNARRDVVPNNVLRELYNFAARVQYDVSAVSFASVTAFSYTDQNINSDFCLDDPSAPLYPAPGGIGSQCTFGITYGDHALPGQPTNTFERALQDFRTVTEDIRVASRETSNTSWTLGASGLYRKTIEGYDIGNRVAPNNTLDVLGMDWNIKKDIWWGLYGQASWKVTPKLEVTANARYDQTKVENSAYASQTLTVPAQFIAPNGMSVSTLSIPTSAFQPKGQVSYHFTDDLMGYTTISRGYRPGFFFYGEYTVPEHTTNYELGIKSAWWDKRMTANLAVFYIDYSDQQFQQSIATAPYVVSITIPKTKIKGAEYETALQLSPFLTIGIGAGYLDALVSDGTHSPLAPRFNLNGTLDYNRPLADNWSIHFHADDRYNTYEYLGLENTQYVGAKNYLNLRLGGQHGPYTTTLFCRNVANIRQDEAAGAELANGAFIRYQNMPRTYGVELQASF